MAFAAAILGWLVLGALALVLLVLVVPWSVTLAGATHPARIRVELRPVSHRVPLRLRVERQIAADPDAVPKTKWSFRRTRSSDDIRWGFLL